MFAARILVAVLVLAVAGCDDPGGSSAADAAPVPEVPTRQQELETLLHHIGNTEAPPEFRVLGVKLLAKFEPFETVDPFVAMLAAEEPLVLVAVIESLPQAAEELASPHLELLSADHSVPEVRAAARARLDEFEAFHQ